MDLLMAIMRGICRSEVKPSMKHAVLQDTYAYYSRKGPEWIVQYPLQDYLAKVSTSVVTNESMSWCYLFSYSDNIVYICYL